MWVLGEWASRSWQGNSWLHYKDSYFNAAWIQAETDESCKESFFTLAEALGLKPVSGESGSKIAKRVFRHTGKHIPSALFIYDNANKLKTTDGAAAFGIEDYLPSEIYSHPPMVLITSQSTTEWIMKGIESITVPQLTQAETIEYFCCRFQLSDTEVPNGDKDLLMAQIKELAECLQGFPPGLRLAAANIDYDPNHGSISKLRRDLDNFVDSIKGSAEMGLIPASAGGRTTTDYSQTLRIVWDVTMKKLEAEECAVAALHLLRILAYCNPDFTRVEDLKVVFQASTISNGMASQGGDKFNLTMETLKKLALVRVYDKESWGVNWGSYVRIQKTLQKLLREEDMDGWGLRSILMTEKASLASHYMNSEPILTMPPSVMQDEDLVVAFLKSFSHGLRLDRTLKNVTATTGGGRFQFGPREQHQLRECGGANVEDILAAVELLQTFEKEKDVGILYLTAARYAKTHDDYFGKLAEIWALTCWASNPAACSPFQFKRLTGTILAVSIVVLFITAFMDVVIDLKEGWLDLIVAQVMHLVFLILVNAASHYVVPHILLCFYPFELKLVLALQHIRLFHAFNMLCTLLWLFGFFMLIVMSCVRTLTADDNVED